jgi:hypothetical protein
VEVYQKFTELLSSLVQNAWLLSVIPNGSNMTCPVLSGDEKVKSSWYQLEDEIINVMYNL